MNNNIIIPQIDEFIKNGKPIRVKIRDSYLKTHYPDFYKLLQNYPGDTISEKMYLYYHGLTKRPLCVVCKEKFTKYINLIEGYKKYCGASCCAKDPDRQEKAKKTNLERYGDVCPSKSQSVKNKLIQTNIERYGGVGFQVEEFKQKVIKTSIERHGEDFRKKTAQKADQTRREKDGDDYRKKDHEKTKQTWLKKYGVENIMDSDFFKEKSKNTMISKYGENYRKVITDKSKQTCLERYGEDNPLKVKKFLKKQQQTNIKKYGGNSPMCDKSIANKNTKSRLDYYVDKNNLIKIEDGCWFCKCPHDECNNCNDKFYKITSSQYYARKQSNIEPCTNLLPISPNGGNGIEMFVRNILDDYHIEYKTNVRGILSNRKELDVYIPSKNIAIECNGVYWHKEDKIGQDYHANKYKECENHNIQLISIWEDWVYIKPQIVKSLILSKLNIYERTIFARKCIIKEVSSSDCVDFLNNNHIQGRTNSKVRLGLYFDGELVSIMTFSKNSKTSGNKINDIWELTRFCSILNTHVIGAAGKLLKYFIKNYNPTTIQSFASNDISNGGLYNKLGFNKEKNITMSYWYVHKDHYIRYHRTSFSKNRLKQMGYNIEGKTENEIMSTLPYYKIYDSGHTKYVLNL